VADDPPVDDPTGYVTDLDGDGLIDVTAVDTDGDGVPAAVAQVVGESASCSCRS
jgi:hypothetical protein